MKDFLIGVIIGIVFHIVSNQGYSHIKISSPQSWVLCGEKLPEVGQWTLVTIGVKYPHVEIARRIEGGWDFDEFDIYDDKMEYLDHVVAWMPLPLPYGGTEQWNI